MRGMRYVDVPLERPCPHAISHSHGEGVVLILVGGKADDVIRVSLHQERQLVKLQLPWLGRIDGDALVYGQRHVSIIVDLDDTVDVLNLRPADRDDGRTTLLQNLVDQRPVIQIERSYFYDVNIQLLTHVHRFLVERGGHGDHAVGFDLVDQSPIGLVG
jgi:hypothetical protein